MWPSLPSLRHFLRNHLLSQSNLLPLLIIWSSLIGGSLRLWAENQLQSQRGGCKFEFCHLLSVWTWSRYFTLTQFPCLPMEIVTPISTIQGCWRGEGRNGSGQGLSIKGCSSFFPNPHWLPGIRMPLFQGNPRTDGKQNPLWIRELNKERCSSPLLPDTWGVPMTWTQLCPGSYLDPIILRE